MPEKKNKENKCPYIIQYENNQQIVSWWDEGADSWTGDPLDATIYYDKKTAEKNIDVIVARDVHIDYERLSIIKANPIFKKKKNWKKNPPIKYIDKPAKKIFKSNLQLKAGTILLDKRTLVAKPILITHINERGSVFSVEPGFPVSINYDPMEKLIQDIEIGLLEILWNS